MSGYVMFIHHCPGVSETISLFLLPFPAATSTWPSCSRWCKTSPGKGKLTGRTESKARRADFFSLYPPDKFGSWGGVGGSWCWAQSRPFWGSAREMMLGKWRRNIFHQLHVWGSVTLSSYQQGKCSLRSWALHLTPDLCIHLCISIHFCYWAMQEAEDLQGECWHGLQLEL